MDVSQAVLLLGGLALLILGANSLVRGATGAATALGVPAFVVGLSVAAFGTSLPELVVSAHSAMEGHGEIALGNVIGSNIFNVLFIMGAAMLVRPPAGARTLARFDAPFALFLTLVLFGFCLDGDITGGEGIVFLALLALFVFHLYQEGKAGDNDRKDQPEDREKSPVRALAKNTLYLAGGLALLVLGARFFVDGAVAVAETLGLGKRIIGIVIVGPGTSLPELAASLAAAYRGRMGIAVGNLVGSNIFNILAVLGLTTALAPGGVTVSPETLSLDLPVLVLTSLLAWPVLFCGRVSSRLAGSVFIAAYTAYVIYLVQPGS